MLPVLVLLLALFLVEAVQVFLRYYTNLVDNAKATKAGYETLMGESDPWCQEYATFFNGLDLDGVLAAAISSGDYATLEAKLAEAENNAIGQALNLFVNGANCMQAQ